MRPTSSQPARPFATAKTHKFIDLKQINLYDFKLRNNRPNWYPFIRLFINNCPIFTAISDKPIYDL